MTGILLLLVFVIALLIHGLVRVIDADLASHRVRPIYPERE